MRVYAAELICSTGVLDFHTFKLALCIHNKLRSHAEMLSWWAFDVTFPGSNPLRSNRSGLNVSNGGSWNPKLTLKVNSLWIKMKGQNFSSQVLSRHTFRILRKKGSDFFDHRGTLNVHFKHLHCLYIFISFLETTFFVINKRYFYVLERCDPVSGIIFLVFYHGILSYFGQVQNYF